MDNMDIVELRGINKEYCSGTKDTVVRALNGVRLDIKRAVFNAVTGTSGSGKSTLLHIMGGLDTATAGSVVYNTGDGSIDITGLGEESLAEFRINYQAGSSRFVYSYSIVPVFVLGGVITAVMAKVSDTRLLVYAG